MNSEICEFPECGKPAKAAIVVCDERIPRCLKHAMLFQDWLDLDFKSENTVREFHKNRKTKVLRSFKRSPCLSDRFRRVQTPRYAPLGEFFSSEDIKKSIGAMP